MIAVEVRGPIYMVKTVGSLPDTLEKYDTAINVIGGIKDYSVLFKVVHSYFDETDSVNQLIYQRNEFNLRTAKSRERIEKAINKSLLSFKNLDHQALIDGVLKDYIPLPDRQLILFWHFALNNRLFREISTQVFTRLFYSGRASINKNDIIAYFKEMLSTTDHEINWSETTINTLSTKYLNLMTKLGFLSPKRNKLFETIKPSSQAVIIFLYFARLFDADHQNLLDNPFLPLMLISRDEIGDRLKKLALKGLFEMNFDGVSLNVDFIYPYQEISHALYDRQSAEVC